MDGRAVAVRVPGCLAVTVRPPILVATRPGPVGRCWCCGLLWCCGAVPAAVLLSGRALLLWWGGGAWDGAGREARAVFSSLNEWDRVVFSRVRGFSPDRVIIRARQAV